MAFFVGFPTRIGFDFRRCLRLLHRLARLSNLRLVFLPCIRNPAMPVLPSYTALPTATHRRISLLPRHDSSWRRRLQHPSYFGSTGGTAHNRRMQVIHRRHFGDVISARMVRFGPSPAGDAYRRPSYFLHLLLAPKRLIFPLISHPMQPIAQSSLLLSRRRFVSQGAAGHAGQSRCRPVQVVCRTIVGRPVPASASRGPRTEGDFLGPSCVCAERGRLGKDSGLVGDNGGLAGLLSLGSGSFPLASSAVAGSGTWRTGRVVEDGRLHAAEQPHGERLSCGVSGFRTEVSVVSNALPNPCGVRAASETAVHETTRSRRGAG